MQIRKAKIPLLANGVVKKGKVIGPGNNNTITRITLLERSGKKRRLVARYRETRFPTKEKAIEYQKKIDTFRKAGLPVPKYSKVDLRENSPTYLHIFQPDLEAKYGKLIPINNNRGVPDGKPAFLANLTLKKDKILIEELASDLVKIHNTKHISFWIDFWHFYKKGDTYGRLIFDLDELHKIRPESNHGQQVLHMFHEIREYMPYAEFQHFVKEYIKQCKHKTLANYVENHFVEKPRGYYSQKEYLKRERAAKKAGLNNTSSLLIRLGE